MGRFRGWRIGGPAREVVANGQPWETRGPASYGDKSEFGRVWTVQWEPSIDPLPSYFLALGPPHSHSTPRQAGEKGVGAAIPKGSNSHPAGQGRKELPIPSTPSIFSP